MTPAEFSSKTNDYLTSYLVFADAKAGALLTFVTILGTAVGFVAPAVLRSANGLSPSLYVAELVGASVLLISVGGTLRCCLSALSPRTMSAGPSLHSFPDLAKMAPADVVAQVAVLTPDDAATALCLHNVTLARIAEEKFSWLRAATRWLSAALLSTLGVTYVYALIAVVSGEKGP